MRKAIPKNVDTILTFLESYRRARLNMLIIPFGLAILGNLFHHFFFSHIPKDQVPLTVIFSLGLFTAWFGLKGLFSFLAGKARCPQCKTTPLVFSKLFGVGPVMGFGIPLFERQIKRCHKCDYPLSLAELEKDLAAEREAQAQASPEVKA
jgi:membrane associated rhomboid family serine protease